jgi:hypothetical protein
LHAPPPLLLLGFITVLFTLCYVAGELESEVAGQPGRLIRERYRKAAELSRVRGKLAALMINDLDAGIGRFGNTQVGLKKRCRDFVCGAIGVGAVCAQAAELSRVRGKLAALMINDLDAGIGRFGNTQICIKFLLGWGLTRRPIYRCEKCFGGGQAGCSLCARS